MGLQWQYSTLRILYARKDCNKWRQLLNICAYMHRLCSQWVRGEKVSDATGGGRVCE